MKMQVAKRFLLDYVLASSRDLVGRDLVRQPTSRLLTCAVVVVNTSFDISY